MSDGVLAPGVLAPCVRYRYYIEAWLSYGGERRRSRCEECGGVIEDQGFIVLATPSATDHAYRNFHPGCYYHGAPWRQAAAERAKERGR